MRKAHWTVNPTEWKRGLNFSSGEVQQPARLSGTSGGSEEGKIWQSYIRAHLWTRSVGSLGGHEHRHEHVGWRC